MPGPSFDDARLESADQLLRDDRLRYLAETGARIRKASLSVPVGHLERGERPRGILVLGSESRLVRAVLEPACPVPFMAWPGPTLPAWVGPLDLVIVLGGHEAPAWEVQCAHEAARRGAQLIVAAPEDSRLAAAAQSHDTTLLPCAESDAMASAVAVLALLGDLDLGPRVLPDHVADAADLVAESCSPARDMSENRAKDLAAGLAEGLPLVWGATVLAARASRRIAEALRRASGQLALAADADELEAVLRAVPPRDLFEDPFETQSDPRPVLLLLDEAKVPERLAGAADRLERLAEAAGVRTCRISSGDTNLENSDVESYVTLLQHGRYAAAYLGIGLGK